MSCYHTVSLIAASLTSLWGSLSSVLKISAGSLDLQTLLFLEGADKKKKVFTLFHCGELWNISVCMFSQSLEFNLASVL